MVQIFIMVENYNRYVSLRISEQARERLNTIVEELRAKPPVPEAGRATVASVASAALIEGLAVLAKRHGLNGSATPGDGER